MKSLSCLNKPNFTIGVETVERNVTATFPYATSDRATTSTFGVYLLVLTKSRDNRRENRTASRSLQKKCVLVSDTCLKSFQSFLKTANECFKIVGSFC